MKRNNAIMHRKQPWTFIMTWNIIALLTANLSNRSEVEVSASRLSEQERGAESKPRRSKIKLKKIVLNLMSTDHNISSRVTRALTVIHKPQAQHIVAHLHHRVCPKDSPVHALTLQHQINGRYRRANPRTAEIRWVEAHSESSTGVTLGMPASSFTNRSTKVL